MTTFKAFKTYSKGFQLFRIFPDFFSSSPAIQLSFSVNQQPSSISVRKCWIFWSRFYWFLPQIILSAQPRFSPSKMIHQNCQNSFVTQLMKFLKVKCIQSQLQNCAIIFHRDSSTTFTNVCQWMSPWFNWT